MDIKILEYNNDVTVKTIDNFDEVEQIFINVISGDEELVIVYKDDSTKVVNPGRANRYEDYIDYIYVIYDKNESINLIDNPRFMNRKDSYWLDDVEDDDLYMQFVVR